MLALPVTLELLKAVPGRYSKILNSVGGINEKELDEGQSVKSSRESLGLPTVEDRLSHRTFEAANHDLIVTPCVNNVKRYHGLPNDFELCGPTPAGFGSAWARGQAPFRYSVEG